MRKQFFFKLKAALIPLIFFTLCIDAIGQNVGIGTTTPAGLLHVSGGNIIVTGIHLQGPALENLPVGPKMFFYPRKGAFRAGAAYNTAWEDANIGEFSIGLGMNALAKTNFSISIGEGNIAEGSPFPVAIGRGNRSAGFASLAMGHFSEATGDYSASIGLRDTVSGFGATALGGNNTVTGAYGFAAGIGNRVNGNHAGTMGTENFSPSFGEFTIGNYATQYTAQSAGGINANDRVFTIGNGQNPGNRSDAMVVLKNGHVGIGTSNPENPLQIATGPGVYTTALSILPSTAEFSKRAEIRLDDWSILQDITGGNNVKDLAIYQYSSNLHRFVISTGGNVGIGTPTPAYTLDVRGPNPGESGIISSGNADLSHKLVLFSGHQSDPNPFIQWKAGDPLRFATDAGGFAELMRINPNGNIGIGTTTPDAKLDVATSMRVLGNQGSFYVHPVFPPGASTVLLATLDGLENGPQMRFESTADGFMDIGLNDAGAFVVEGNDDAKLTVTVNGDVGIGTNNPTAKMDLVGKLKITDGTQGAGKVLTSDENGLAHWESKPMVEAGNYEPTWVTSTGFTAAPSIRNCEYSRVGNLVSVVCRFGGSGPTTVAGTNTATITVPPGLQVADPAGGRLISGIFASDHYRNGSSDVLGIIAYNNNTSVIIKINNSPAGIAGSWCSFTYQTNN